MAIPGQERNRTKNMTLLFCRSPPKSDSIIVIVNQFICVRVKIPYKIPQPHGGVLNVSRIGRNKFPEILIILFAHSEELIGQGGIKNRHCIIAVTVGDLSKFSSDNIQCTACFEPFNLLVIVGVVDENGIFRSILMM